MTNPQIRQRDDGFTYVASIKYSPFYEKLNETAKKFVDDFAEKKSEVYNSNTLFKALVEVLKQMNLEVVVTKDIHSIHLPKEYIFLI
jgi:hypothetical protein